QRILLLHNVSASLNSDKEKARFPFHLYKQTRRNEKWSLEHIHAQNSEQITKKEDQITWLADHIQSLKRQDAGTYHELIERMESLKMKHEIDKETYEKLVNDVYVAMNEVSGMDNISIHSIGNLCLLDKNTNSQLNNSVFDVKRERM